MNNNSVDGTSNSFGYMILDGSNKGVEVVDAVSFLNVLDLMIREATHGNSSQAQHEDTNVEPMSQNDQVI